MSGTTVRDGRPGDLAACYGLHAATQAEHAARLPDLFPSVPSKGNVDAFGAAVGIRPLWRTLLRRERDRHLLQIAERDGAFAGHLLTRFAATGDGRPVRVAVIDLSVRAGARRMGVATALLDALDARIGAADEPLLLEAQSWAGGPVADLFERRGWTVAGRTLTRRVDLSGG